MGAIIGRLGAFSQGSIKEVNIQGKPYLISNIDDLLFTSKRHLKSTHHATMSFT